MNVRKIIILIVAVFLFCNLILLFAFRDKSEAKINLVEVNDITQSLAREWNSLGENELPGLEYDLDYVVLDHENNFIVATRNGLNNNLNSAISNRDTIVDITYNDQTLGKLIIYNNTNYFWDHYKFNLLTFTLVTMTLVAFFSVIYVLYLNKSIFLPFRKLQEFSRHVAQGNLDLPLEMDKGNLFGAFTESFDLMREELKKARENERIANQSKKELVASLSHDIKTPVASIKAVSEIMTAKTQNEYEIKQLEIINSKADQINTLITNMFNATLEELHELKVSVTEESSKVIYDLIKNADYNHQVTILSHSECIVFMDVLRLSQVIDNVISNSYKYANTSIYVSISIKDQFLEVIFKDFGLGVSKEEIPLIFNKFYRAKNSEGKNGTGLGLYISKYLMNKMSGDIDCENAEDGFVMRLKLRIS